MIQDTQLAQILVDANLFSNEQIQDLLTRAQQEKKTILDSILSQKLLSEDALYETIATSYSLPFIQLKDYSIRQDVLFLIPEPIAKTHDIVAFDQADDIIKIAAIDPDDIQTFEFLQKRLPHQLALHITTPSSISAALKQYHKNIQTEFQKLTQGATDENSKDLPPNEKLKQLAEDLPIVRIVNTLLEYAIFENASDIHIEPTEKEVIVRYRVDGILREVMKLPKTVQSGLIARIKILSNLKLDEHRLPQDGRFKIEGKDYKIAFRVSILPVYDGEKIVMRLLNEKNQQLELKDLGWIPSVQEVVERNLNKPHGMILVTGPTGSGKTTTLYAMLNTLNRPEVNISTIEDPIEYRMEHVNQSQVAPHIGFTFAAGLRALLRQDPNIIMVGEIRDQETAEIGIHAAMTGHLVLSTLHTNEAAGTLPRLLDMGIVPFLVASTTNIIIAQRLVRKICDHCIGSYRIEAKAMEEMEKQFDLKELMRVMAQTGAVMSEKEQLTSVLFYRGKGCKKCHDSGYRGRIGIYEVIEMSETIRTLVMERADTDKIKKTAIEHGMITMLQDGFVKAKSGVTTVEEVLRVTRE